jgi:hypothetical protein
MIHLPDTTWTAAVTVTHYDETTGEPHQRDLSFGRGADDDFGVVEAGNEERAQDEVREVLIRDTTDDIEIDRIDVYEE